MRGGRKAGWGVGGRARCAACAVTDPPPPPPPPQTPSQPPILLGPSPLRGTPGLLYTLAAALFVAGPVAAYVIPDSSPALVGLQVALAAACVAGGSAAFGGASLLATLQK